MRDDFGVEDEVENMSDLISREALSFEISKAADISFTAFKCVMAKIRKAPAIDAVEVVHGEWKICSDGYYPYCSICNEEPKNGTMTSYCPECGAKMDKCRESEVSE